MLYIEKRRSIREIDRVINITDHELVNELTKTLKHTPSSYNAQSQRMMILLHESHHRFWKLVMDELRRIVPEDQFPRTEKKINGFYNGYGTVLFFDEASVTKELTDKFPLYKENFLNWAREQNGMLQINVWNVLTAFGIGASLQHYNEVIEEKAKEMFNIPSTWKMVGQMPFGNPLEVPQDKKFVDIDKRIKVLD